MIFLPLLDRELRTAARQPFTYSLRVVGVLATFLVAAVFTLKNPANPAFGAKLFESLHQTIFAAIWVFVPFLTADCISREKREGTLPLLSLTAIKPLEIAVAKAAANALRAFALWLSAVPVLAIPMLMGGVTWTDLMFSTVMHFSSLCLATGSGLLASSLSRVFTRALALTFTLASLVFGVFLLVISLTFVALTPVRSFNLETDYLLFGGFLLATNRNATWQNIGTALPSKFFLVYGPPTVLVLCVSALCLMVVITAKNIRRSWAFNPPSAAFLKIYQRFCRPIMFQRILGAWMNRTLQRNPIGWLEHRTWSSRLVMWSWLAVIISVYSMVFSDFNLFQRGFVAIQTILAWLLGASLAMSAAGSFRRERETGVLELLLVAPIRERQIITGRLRGLWMQFTPTVALWVVIWIFFTTSGLHEVTMDAALRSICGWLVTFVTVPIIGLYFSLNQRSYVTAFVFTLFLGQILPLVLYAIIPGLPFGPATWQMGLATLLGFCLHSDLTHRKFRAQRES